VRPLFNGCANGFAPRGFAPYVSRLPASEAARLDGQTHPVPNPTNPGYAYGTAIPLTQPKVWAVRWYMPWTLPVARTFSNQIPMKPQIAGVTMDVTRGVRVPGSISTVHGGDYSALDALQAKLAQMKR
jgi:hypothetical protein